MSGEVTAVPLEGELREQVLLSLANKILTMLGINDGDRQQQFGEIIVTAGGLLISGAPPVIASGVVVEGLGIPADLAGDLIHSMLIGLNSLQFTDQQGRKTRALITERPNFSLKEWMLRRDQCVMECMGTFMKHDYLNCAALAEDAAKYYLNSMLYQMMVISMQRLEMEEDAKAAGARALKALTYTPWHRSLMAVTLGMIETKKLLGAASDDGQRCQIHFYEGMRYLTLGQTLQAKIALAECVKCNTDMIEIALAKVEIEHIK